MTEWPADSPPPSPEWRGLTGCPISADAPPTRRFLISKQDTPERWWVFQRRLIERPYPGGPSIEERVEAKRAEIVEVNTALQFWRLEHTSPETDYRREAETRHARYIEQLGRELRELEAEE